MLSFTWPEYSSSVPKSFFPFQESSLPKKDTVHLYIVKNNSCALVYHRIRLKSHSLSGYFLLLLLNSRNACNESKIKSSRSIPPLKGQKHAKNNIFPSVSVHTNLAGREHDKFLLSMASKQSSEILRTFSEAGSGTTHTFIFRYLLPHLADKALLGNFWELKKLVWEQNVIVHYNEAFYKWVSNHFCWSEKNRKWN